MPDFTDEVALVTGTARGNGSAVARILADGGASLGLAGVDEAGVDSLAEDLVAGFEVGTWRGPGRRDRR